MKENKKSPSSFMDQMSKEFSKIYTSCNKAKQGAIAEIGKIDEKYRKMAEEEKKQLTELVKNLEEQMKMYAGYLGLGKGDEATETLEPAPAEEMPDMTAKKEEEAEPVITDTIFPENNEPEEVAEPAPVVEGADESAPALNNLDAEEDAEWDKRIESGELKEVEQPEWTSTDPAEDWPVEEQPEEKKEEEKEPILVTDDETGWPEFPADWK